MRIAGVVTKKDHLIWVVLKCRAQGDPEYVSHGKMHLSTGPRPSALARLFDDVRQRLSRDAIRWVIVHDFETVSVARGQAVDRSAELRGVVMAAVAHAGTLVDVRGKAWATVTLGDGRFAEYADNDELWNSIAPGLHRYAREAATLALAFCRVEEH